MIFISKDKVETEVEKDFIDTKKYGNIKQIIIRDEINDTTIEDNETTQRTDRNNYYSNMHQFFDCQRFCYYLQHGKESTYHRKARTAYNDDFKNEGALHKPGRFYKITAYTKNFGNNSQYSQDDMSLHYYVCLAPDVFVSKFGGSNILFTSYKQIVDAYFPAKFVKGIREEV